MDFLRSSAFLKPGMVKTNSRMRMWWLTTVRNFKVEQIITHPKKYSMGRLKYSRTWLLKP
ncbi:MAG: hypothetical protein AMXMBFR84_49160 [Candidatus Hydrogenedentota bacterium]